MTDYTKTTNFTAKDTLATGNSAKIVKGSEIDVEFNNIATAVATKIDEVSIASTKLVAGNGAGGISDSGLTVSDVLTASGSGALLVPVGGLMMWGTGTAPSGWLLCDGSAVSRTTYSGLFAVIGTTFGVGDGSTTFNLPTFVDRFPVGAGSSYSLNSSGGAATHTLTEAEIPNHRHLEYHNGTDGDWGAPGNCASFPYISGAFASCSGTNPYPSNIYTGYTGSDGAHNNLPPYRGIQFIIKT